MLSNLRPTQEIASPFYGHNKSITYCVGHVKIRLKVALMNKVT